MQVASISGISLALYTLVKGVLRINGILPTNIKARYSTYLLLFCVVLLTMPSHADVLERITLNPKRIDSNGESRAPSISADGRYTVFHSSANNLDFSDQNGFDDVYLYDHQRQRIQRVSVSSTGEEGDFISRSGNIAAQGRFIAFQSDASNLVANDTNRATDIFVHDLTTAATTRVSLSSDGREGNLSSIAPAISGDGRYVVFQSESNTLTSNTRNNIFNIFLHDRETAATQLISTHLDGSATDGFSFNPKISQDGRYIVYTSEATGLVADDTNEMADIFVYDQVTTATRRVSVNAAGEQANDDSFSPAISAEGRYIVFASRATNLVPNDTNGVADIFVYDTQTNGIVRVNVSSAGVESDAAATMPAIAGGGRYIAFNSAATNLVTGDDNNTIDVFLHDLTSGDTRLLSVPTRAASAATASFFAPTLSHDGRWIAFESRMANLVSNDFNRVHDIFLYDRLYMPRFSLQTTEFKIPALVTQTGEIYTAELVLHQAEPIQFTVTQLETVSVELDQVSTTYLDTTALLTLPSVDVLQPDGELQQYRVNMHLQTDPFPYMLDVIELERLD